MPTRRWWHAVGIVAVGACLALGTGHGVATADEDGSAGSSESASTNTSTAETGITNDEVAQHESSTSDKEPAKPTSTVSAATVTIEKDVEKDPVVEPDAAPTENATPSKSTKHDETPVAVVTRPAEPPMVVTATREITTRTAVDVTPPKPTIEPSTEPKTITPAAAPTVEIATDEAPPAVARTNAVVAAVPAMAPPPQPNLINVIGTLLFTVLTLPLRLLEQTPVVPPGYSVTVGRSTLDIGCGCGQTVDARWYFPDADAHGGVAPRSVVYLQHGFIRSNANMSAMAIEMAERTNSVVVTPTLTSNPFTADGCWINGEPMQRAVADLFVGDRAALTASAVAAGWTGGALPAAFVLAGHSAGGGLAAAAAGYTVDDGAVSNLLLVLLLDGVPTGDALPVALGKLTGESSRQVLQIASPPYVWNSGGVGVEQQLQARPGEFVGVRLVGGSHVDYEGASSDLLAQLACGFPRQENVRAAQDLAVGWIDDAIAGRRITAPGGSGQTVTIPTTAGAASAVVLGGVRSTSTTAGSLVLSRV